MIFFSLCAMKSCREQEIDLLPEKADPAEKIHYEKVYMKTEKDSVESPRELYLDGNGNEVFDPPPKDRDQWKY